MLASLELRYDPAEADRLFEEALVPAGASRDSDGRWTYGGQPIEITVFVRSDDAVRKSIGDRLVADLDRAGFAANRYTGICPPHSALCTAPTRGSDVAPVHGGLDGPGAVKYDDSILAQYYAPWWGFLPGGQEDHLWQYENEELDELTQSLHNMEFDSQDERASLIRDATELGVRESVRIFLVVEHVSYAVRDGITGVVNAQGFGITSRFTPINAQLSDGSTHLDIGVFHVAAGSWNPVGDCVTRTALPYGMF